MYSFDDLQNVLPLRLRPGEVLWISGLYTAVQAAGGAQPLDVGTLTIGTTSPDNRTLTVVAQGCTPDLVAGQTGASEHPIVALDGPSYNLQHVFARNISTELVHYYWSPQPGWQAENLAQYCSIGQEFRFVDNLVVLNGPSTEAQHAFARNADNELLHYYWSPQPGWQAENLTRRDNIGSRFRFVADLAVVNLVVSGQGYTAQNAFGRNADGELVHYYWSPEPSWQAENLTQ